jgi:hypothetical protein
MSSLVCISLKTQTGVFDNTRMTSAPVTPHTFGCRAKTRVLWRLPHSRPRPDTPGTEKEITLYPGGPPPKFQGEQLRVMLHINTRLSRRITRTELLNHPALRDLSIIKMPQGTNFKVSDEQAGHLASLASAR